MRPPRLSSGREESDYTLEVDRAVLPTPSLSLSDWIFVKASGRRGGSGRGSIVFHSFSLSRSTDFRTSASGKRAYDPTLFLRFCARKRRPDNTFLTLVMLLGDQIHGFHDIQVALDEVMLEGALGWRGFRNN